MIHRTQTGRVRKVQFKDIFDLETAILKIIPDASLNDDDHGQIVIYTGLTNTIKGKLRTIRETDSPQMRQL
jgi:hypothetical protein